MITRDEREDDGGEHRGAFIDDVLPDGSVVSCEALASDITDIFDFVVIGSGAGGAVAAHTLTSAGYTVALIEEGPWVKTREFNDNVFASFSRMMRHGGTQVLSGRAFMPVLQGRCVGGSTAVNSAIAWRTPEDVLGDWSARFGLGQSLSMRELDAHFEALERELHVQPVEEHTLGANNQMFLEAASRAGFSAQAMHRYERGCRGAGQCLTGCPFAAKQAMNVSYVPWALSRGARIFTSCRAEKIEARSGRAVGVLAYGTSTPASRRGKRVFLHARRGVFLAASTIQTPNILHRSRVRSPALGKHFQAHPGVGMVGLFDREVAMYAGATQGAESIAFRQTDGFKLETLAMPPELAAVRVPGIGTEFIGRMAQLGHCAVWVAHVRAEAQGTVSPGFAGADRIRFSLTRRDMEVVRNACTTIAELLFLSGAREVWPGIFGLPSVLRSVDDVRHLVNAPLDSRAYSFIATHLFGAARMGPDARASVVGLDFSTHAISGLYVVDSSVFPTNLGVNPQHSIMAMSRLATTRVAQSPLSVAA